MIVVNFLTHDKGPEKLTRKITQKEFEAFKDKEILKGLGYAGLARIDGVANIVMWSVTAVVMNGVGIPIFAIGSIALLGSTPSLLWGSSTPAKIGKFTGNLGFEIVRGNSGFVATPITQLIAPEGFYFPQK